MDSELAQGDPNQTVPLNPLRDLRGLRKFYARAEAALAWEETRLLTAVESVSRTHVLRPAAGLALTHASRASNRTPVRFTSASARRK